MQRERLTITLDTELLAAVDATIDRSSIRNRSHAIEHAIREGLAVQEVSRAVLALSGQGSELLPALLKRLEGFSLTEYIVVSAAGALEQAQAVARSVTELTEVPARVIPGDFGTGAALLLNKQLFEAPFIYALLNENLAVPGSLVPAYVQHRRSSSLITRVLIADEAGTLAETGVSLISPDIIPLIPAGIASLEAEIFPGLAKGGRVGAYVTEYP